MKIFFENMEDDFLRKTGLTQWDYGQKLEILGLKGIANAELHFAWKMTGSQNSPCGNKRRENLRRYPE